MTEETGVRLLEPGAEFSLSQKESEKGGKTSSGAVASQEK